MSRERFLASVTLVLFRLVLISFHLSFEYLEMSVKSESLLQCCIPNGLYSVLYTSHLMRCVNSEKLIAKIYESKGD